MVLQLWSNPEETWGYGCMNFSWISSGTLPWRKRSQQHAFLVTQVLKAGMYVVLGWGTYSRLKFQRLTRMWSQRSISVGKLFLAVQWLLLAATESGAWAGLLSYQSLMGNLLGAAPSSDWLPSSAPSEPEFSNLSEKTWVQKQPVQEATQKQGDSPGALSAWAT